MFDRVAAQTKVSFILITLSLVLVGVWWRWSSDESPEASEAISVGEIRFQPDSYYDEPWVYFLGDSYSTGTPMDSGVQWPDIISAERGWYMRDYASRDSGYLMPGAKNLTILDRINGSRLDSADMVIISGGLEDLKRGDGSKIGPAILDTLLRAKELAPHARIVVLSVFAPGPSAKLNNMNTLLRRVSERIDAEYIDVSSVLIDSPGMLGSDGTFPTDAGQKALATEIGSRLRN
ncbi:SGNH/GDSL hydrolase family protein [Rhodococcus sp. H36-A4]|uniref:SGNH/GDSL hydrolase family protein n=1 Tax=Rhodococcus sp. H36-A4 TaxID=3004353 RepID=UPI0022AE9B36|nr:SGNH/GDSL hydrolase family protein [Rhodococcus sp. H36-A4]MCZ4076986.1 SGNH/GDSL hydrolase family protein [Rhodococcus sp. H36-A4]